MRKAVLILGHNYATQFVDIYNQYTRIFDQDKFEVTVAYLTGKPEESVRERTLAPNIVFLDVPNHDLRNLKLRAIKKLRQFCQEKQFQIVICHRYKATYIMLWVAQFQKIPALVFVMHELRTMTSMKRKLAIALLARHNMLFAGVSNAVSDDIRKTIWRVPKERVTTLYNMIDVDLTEPQLLSRQKAREALGLADDDFVFGNIARLVPNKDQTNLIHAFSLVKPYHPNAKLIIIGDGVLEEKLKAQVKEYGLINDVLFTGFLTSGFRFMKAFDCFVLNSVQEAFGRVLLEAMIARLPIIATAVHGIPEVMGETGVLVKARDPVQFAAAMKQVIALSQAEREQWGNKAYQHAINNFSIPKFYEQFWQLPLVHFIRD